MHVLLTVIWFVLGLSASTIFVARKDDISVEDMGLIILGTLLGPISLIFIFLAIIAVAIERYNQS